MTKSTGIPERCSGSIKCVLTRIYSTHSNLRTSSIEGECSQLPAAGQQFHMTAPPLTEGIRWVQTSPIEQTWSNVLNGVSIVCFKTANSVYGLTVTEEATNDPTRS